jgi:hypothetical protein
LIEFCLSAHDGREDEKEREGSNHLKDDIVKEGQICCNE